MKILLIMILFHGPYQEPDVEIKKMGSMAACNLVKLQMEAENPKSLTIICYKDQDQ